MGGVMFMNETINEQKESGDFADTKGFEDDPYKNEIIEYKGNRVGKTLIRMIIGMFGIGISLALWGFVFFLEGAKRNKETIEKYEQMLEAMEKVVEEDSNKIDSFEAKLNKNQKDILEVISANERESISETSKSIENENVNSEKETDEEKEIIENETANDESVIFARRKVVDSAGNAEYRRNATNTLGEELEDVFYMFGKKRAKATFYLGKKYSKFSANISCPDEKSIQGDPFELVIYANNDTNKVLYTTKMNRSFAVTPIELDVAGVDFLTFKVTKNTVLQDFAGLLIDEGNFR